MSALLWLAVPPAIVGGLAVFGSVLVAIDRVRFGRPRPRVSGDRGVKR